MESDQVFAIRGSTAKPAKRVSLAEHLLRERQDMQEWVKSYPSILGEELLVVTEEFDRWMTASGERTAERLDVLALDRAGRLVVAELKRHRAPDSVLVQALNYAAMTSRFTLDDLVEAHARFIGSSEQDARTALEGWAQELSDATLAPPRIVLVAEDFGPVLTNTTMFLLESGLDVRLIKLGLHELPDGSLTLTSSQVLPVQKAEEFMIGPGSPTHRRTSGRIHARGGSFIQRLIEGEAFREGQVLRISVPPVRNLDRQEIQQWLDAVPERAEAVWQNDRDKPFLWKGDGSEWAMKPLVREIVRRATGTEGDVWGPNWFLAPDGRTINKVADELFAEED